MTDTKYGILYMYIFFVEYSISIGIYRLPKRIIHVIFEVEIMENFSGKIFNAYLSRCNILLLFWNVNFVNIYIYNLEGVLFNCKIIGNLFQHH